MQMLRNVALICLLAGLTAAWAQELKPEAVREVQQKYQAELKAATGAGVTKKFAPEMVERAGEWAKKGEDSLAAGRLVEARDAFRKARWQLPILPAEFPEHV